MKVLLVLVCYALSGVGVLFMGLATTVLAAVSGKTMIVVVILWLAAFLAHHRMCAAWVGNRRLGCAFSLTAFTLGVLGFFALPLAAVVVNRESVSPLQALTVALIELLLVSPAAALAAYLNRYHAGAEPSDQAVAAKSDALPL